MKHGSLFSGIGGFDLGFQRAGIETIWQVEIDEYCRRVLASHFERATRYEDVRTVGRHNLAPVDIISGGFPCQDISHAGKGAGIDGERSGLWSEYARIVRELRPRYVVVENVSALLSRGLERVLGDLAEIGYDAEWQSIRAADVGAPHRRERIWIVAYPARDERSELRWPRERAGAVSESGRGSVGLGAIEAKDILADAAGARCDRRTREEQPIRGQPLLPARSGGCGELGDAIEPGLEGHAGNGAGAPRRSEPHGPAGAAGLRHADAKRCFWRSYNEGQGPAGRDRITLSGGGDVESGVGLLADGLPFGLGEFADFWKEEPEIPRVAKGVEDRVPKLKGLGNAIVPQIAEFIAKRILECEQ